MPPIKPRQVPTLARRTGYDLQTSGIQASAQQQKHDHMRQSLIIQRPKSVQVMAEPHEAPRVVVATTRVVVAYNCMPLMSPRSPETHSLICHYQQAHQHAYAPYHVLVGTRTVLGGPMTGGQGKPQIPADMTYRVWAICMLTTAQQVPIAMRLLAVLVPADAGMCRWRSFTPSPHTLTGFPNPGFHCSP